MTEQHEQDGQREATVASASSSPYATGGGGVTFERRVATRYLAHLLTGASSPELGSRRVVRVAFQQAPSHPVDDLVVWAARDGEDMASLELSVGVRRKPGFVISDMDTKKLIGSFLIAAQKRPAEGVERRLVICVAGPQNAAAQVEGLAGLARTRNAAAFCSDLAVPGRFDQTLKDRLRHLKALVKANLEALDQDSSDKAVDAASWLLLSQLHVLMPRLEPPDELDWAGLLDQLESWARDPTLDAATALRSRLEVLAASYAPTAASVDQTMLRRDAHDCLDLGRRRSQQAWAELDRLDGDARAAIRSNIGGGDGSLKLPRPAPEGELRQAIGTSNLVIVTGDSGVGKSALVKAVIEAQNASGDTEFQAVMLNLRQLPAQMAVLRALLGQPLERLLGELSAPNRMLVIDAADFVLESDDQMLRALVTAAQSASVSVWVVSATEGLAAVKNAVQTLPGDPLEIDIEGLTDEDITSVVDAFPTLRRLADDARARELLRRPVVADLLARAEPGSPPLSESDALNVIWGKLVRNDGRPGRGTPAAREQVFLQLARHELERSDSAVVSEVLNPEGLDGLRRDGLLRTSDNSWSPLPAFAHDLLRIFAVAKLLLSDGDPAARLQTHRVPRWALPAARLAAQVMLAAPDTPAWPLAGRLARLQGAFDQLAAAGFGERWSDLPTEAVLTLPNAPVLLGDAWGELVTDEAAGLKRVLRLIDQRHSKDGLADRLVAQPVVELLLDRGPATVDGMATDLFRSWLRSLLMSREQEGEPTRIKLREHLVGFVAAGDRRLAEIADQRAAALAARTPEEKAADEEQQNRIQRIAAISGVSRRRRRYVELPDELISESTMELLALLGPDLGVEGEDLLRRVAEDDPYRLAPALESGLTGLGLRTYRPELLVDLAEAYYLDDDTNAEDGFGGGLHDDGIRDHQFGGLGTPFAAYYRGPFIWMFRSSFRESVACLNRLLNHAARFRVAALHSPGWGQPRRSDPDRFRTELSLTGVPRSYIGDEHVWLWYRGTGVGPYPCMSALQALELVCDEFIEAGAPLDRLVSVLLDDCENLAMPGLVVGLLVRHIEKAGEALDPYLVEPAIWHLESNRIVNESSGLAANAASVKSPERRKWSPREASMMLALYADEARAQQLRELGDRLFARALELHRVTEPVEADGELAEELATVRGWAGALDRTSYQFTQTDEGIVVKQKADPEVEKVLAGTNEDSRRGHHGYRLWNRYPDRHDRDAKHAAVTLDELIDDLAIAKDLLENPPALGLGNRYDAPAAVAAAALEVQFRDGLDVPHEGLIWSVGVLLDVVEDRRSVLPHDLDTFSYFSRGADRSAARGLLFLLLPQAAKLRVGLMTAHGPTDDQISDNLAWLLSSGATEARLFAAKSLDLVWAAPCDHTATCRHGVAISLVEESIRGCRKGVWNGDGRTEPPRLEGDVASSLNRLGGEEIVVPFLSAAIRALGAAASMDNCCERGRSHELLAAVLAAHRRGMAGFDHGYQHSRTDSLIAARALLMLAVDGSDALLLEHFDAYAEDRRLLEELLNALAAAAEENQQLADTARRLWPALIDRGLDLLGEPKPPTPHEGWRRRAIAAFMPNPSYDYGYLYRELDSEPIVWTDVEAWQPQVARWLPMAAGQRESVDSLVHLLHSVPDDQQGRLGLTWVETLVRADPSEVACKSFPLPEWLHDVRPHLHEPDLIDCWQRIVDMLIVAGDTRVANLAD